MAIIKERLSASDILPPWVRHELVGRYEFAARYVAGKTVVDCACADGRGSVMLRRAGARRVHGMDLSRTSVLGEARLVRSEGLGFLLGNALRPPIPDGSVDVFVSLETIEHLPDQGAFLSEVRRVLKPDGVLVCSSPNRTVYSPGRTINDKPWNPFHVREYSTEEYEELLGGHFGAVEIFGQNPESSWRVRLMTGLAWLLPGHGAVRIRQALKLPRFLYDKVEHHRVAERDPRRHYELLVAVCRLPLVSAVE